MSTPPGPQEPTGPESPYGATPPSYGSAPPPPAYGGGGYQPAGSPPPNHLVWAIISIFLCWPLAIPAIVFSTQVSSKWQQGDAAGAAEASAKARKFALWATIAGAVYWVLMIILFAAGVFASIQQGSSY